MTHCTDETDQQLVINTHNACTGHAFTACTGHACMCMHNIETGWIATPGTRLPDGVQTVFKAVLLCFNIDQEDLGISLAASTYTLWRKGD